jgi:hypothetical protein
VQKLTNVDAVILGTGYRYGFPFLLQYHNTTVHDTGRNFDSHDASLITDGTHVRSLFLDTFHIDQPTLAFPAGESSVFAVGFWIPWDDTDRFTVNFGVQTFSYTKYTSEAIAKVWSGQAKLPSKEIMWDAYWNTVDEQGGLGKDLHWLSQSVQIREHSERRTLPARSQMGKRSQAN